MSYILDALRKSDQQRKRGVPLLLAAQGVTNAPRRPPRLLYALVALVLLGAGVAIGWLRPWQEQTLPEARVVLKPAAPAHEAAPAAGAVSPPQSPATEPAASPAAPQPGDAATIAAAIPPARPDPAAQKSTKAGKQALAPRGNANTVAAQTTPRANTVAAQTTPRANTGTAQTSPRDDTVAAQTTPRANTAATRTMPRADTDAPSASRATAAAAARDSTEGATAENRTLPRSTASQSAVPDPTPAPVQTAMAITELPVSIQKDLPALSVMVHAYSDDPAKRLVGINNRLLHEGDEVAPGLKLETITLDGMILSYKGYTFRRGVR